MDSSAPVSCKTEQPSGGTLWRDGQYAVGRVGDLEFPDRCAACNAQVGLRRESVTLVHRSPIQWYRWWEFGPYFFSDDPQDADWVDVLLPLCNRHSVRRTLGGSVVAVSLVVGLAAALSCTCARKDALGVLCLAATLAGACLGLWLRSAVGLKRKQGEHAWFKVGRRFLDSLPATPPWTEQAAAVEPDDQDMDVASMVTARANTSMDAYRGGGPPAWVAGNVWRDGDCVVGDPDDLVLPDRCVICDAPCKGQRQNVSIRCYASGGRGWIRHVWPFHGLNIDRFLLFAVPICKKHARRADAATTLMTSSLLVALVAMNVAFFSRGSLVVVLVALLAAWVGYRLQNVVRVERIGSDKVWLKVGRRFLESIPRARRAS
jgi:hypothetical protein